MAASIHSLIFIFVIFACKGTNKRAKSQINLNFFEREIATPHSTPLVREPSRGAKRYEEVGTRQNKNTFFVIFFVFRSVCITFANETREQYDEETDSGFVCHSPLAAEFYRGGGVVVDSGNPEYDN